MGNKKIGAFITLDGEKQFRQDVTNCNKSLSTLKSEMSLVKAQSEGQANSLDSLRKKHEVLGKTLDAHKEKEEAVQKGLDHARISYEKVGIKLEEYRKNLQEAQLALTQMQQDSNATDEELKKQKDTVEELTKIVEKGEETYNRAGNRIQDWESKLNTARAQTIKATAALNENAAYMREAETATDQCATSIDEFGKKTQQAERFTWGFAETLRNNLYNTAIDLVKEGLQEAGKSVLEFDSSTKHLQASTGLAADEMERYEEVMRNLYKEDYGESMSDIADSMALIKQYTNETNPNTIKEMTENGIAMRDVFDMDLSETIRGIDVLVSEMGLTAQEAFDLMATGAQNGLNKSGELADNIAEYGPLWAQAGFSAKEMFAILDNGLSSGAYNLDKVNDFVKEFGISLSDGRIEESLDSFSEETGNLFRKWQAGKATTKDVFYSVINDLNKATNKQEALTVASNTWSSLGEDNALKVIASLDKTNEAYEDVKGTMEEIKDIKYDTLESRIEQLGRRVTTELAEPLIEEYLPGIEKGLDLIINNTDKLIPLTEVAVAGIVTYKTASAAIAAYESATKLAAESQGILNMVMNANPAVLLSTAVIAVGTALIFMRDQENETVTETQTLLEESKKLNEEMDALSEEMGGMKEQWENTTATMDAQKGVAADLVDELYKLESQTNKTAGEKERMEIILGELNELFPELALEIDKETGNLNQNRKAVEKSIEASLAFSKAKAAEEKLAEISEKLVDAELKKYEAQEKNKEISDKIKANEEDINKIREEATNGVVEYNGVIQDSTRAIVKLQIENDKLREQETEGKESVKELQENYDSLSGTYESVKGYMQEQIDASAEVAEAYGKSGEAAATSAKNQQEAAEITAAKIAETYTGIQQTVSDVLNSQMNMFEEFNADTDLTTEKLLENMQSQIDGVSNWADNLAELADRGINQNLLTYLSEMGPEGAAYVATFASMSDEELKKANEMWTESMNMKEGTQESVQGMLESYTEALNGGKEQVKQACEGVGQQSIQGLVESLSAGTAKAEAAGKDVTEAMIDSMNEGAGVQSPSWKTKETAKNTVQGLAIGLKTSTHIAEQAASQMSQKVIKKIDVDLAPSKFQKAGKSIPDGIRTGINAGQSAVMSTVTRMTTGIMITTTAALSVATYMAIGNNLPSGLKTGINAGKSSTAEAASSLASTVHSRAANVGSLYSTGYNLSAGMASGILGGRSLVINAVASVCASAVRQANKDLEINSPSKKFKRIGLSMAEGQGVGYKEGTKDLNRMIKESVEIPKIQGNHYGTREINSKSRAGGIDYRELTKAFESSTTKIIKTVLKEANIELNIGGRKLDRVLRDRGVMYG